MLVCDRMSASRNQPFGLGNNRRIARSAYHPYLSCTKIVPLLKDLAKDGRGSPRQ